MILSLWSEEQEGDCEDIAEVRGSVLKIFINVACI